MVHPKRYKMETKNRMAHIGLHADRLRQLLLRFSQPPTAPIRPLILREWVIFFAWATILLLFFNTYVFQNFTIPTGSMENNLLIGDHITVNKFVFGQPHWKLESKVLPYRSVERGDVVVLKWPGNPRQNWIKRCIGLPGDRFEIRSDKPWVNGQPLTEGYAFFKDLRARKANARDPDNEYLPIDYFELKPGLNHAASRRNEFISLVGLKEVTRAHILRNFPEDSPEAVRLIKALDESQEDEVPKGFYLVMGDNRNYSSDSREWGLLPEPLIKGRAYLVWWSYGADLNTHQLKGRDLILSYLNLPTTFWTRTHWQKCFRLIR